MSDDALSRPAKAPHWVTEFSGAVSAGARGRWGLAAACGFLEAVGLVLVAQAIWPKPDAAPSWFWPALGVALFAASYGLVLLTRRWFDRRETGEESRTHLAITLLLVVLGYSLVLHRFVAAEPVAALAKFPAPQGLDRGAAQIIDTAVDWMKRAWVDFFDAFTFGLRQVLNFIETVFVATPWPVIFGLAILAAFRLSGARAAIFTAASLAYLGLFGFWEKSMATLALVATSVIICLIFGLPLGILAAKSRRFKAAIEPVLDVMQTLPTFVYLIPAVAFFSIGKPPGIISTVIFALPPMVRLTALGIEQVPAQVREAAHAFGASPLQLLTKVELPLAIPSIRLGINQTIMMSLSMVVVAAMIGAGGLGLEVMHSLQHLKTGQGFLAGIAIVLCAMVLDRMVRGRKPTNTTHRED